MPDENSDEFPGLLMFAVEARVAELELTAPWSVSELRLSQQDRERLLAWGQLAEWDFHDDFRNYQTKHGEKNAKANCVGTRISAFRIRSSPTIWRLRFCMAGD